MRKLSTARRFARARQAYAESAQGRYERNREHFGALAIYGNTARDQRREVGRWALEAGAERIAEVVGTEFEQFWRDEVARFAEVFAKWQASQDLA